jgi:nitroreductase
MFPGHDAHPNLILRSFVHWALLAPSTMNTQPWQFRTEDGVLELHADRTRALAVVDPCDRELTMACGAAFYNLVLACRHFGYEAVVERFPDPHRADLLATLRLGPRRDPTGEENRLYASITRRRTNGFPFDERPVEESVLHSLARCTQAEHAWCHLVPDFTTKHRLAELVAEADRVQFHDKRYRRELAAWIHPNRSQLRDGLPGFERGTGALRSLLEPFIIRHFDVGASEARRDRALAELAPALAVIGTSDDRPINWFRAGEALEHALLVATSAGLSASFLNQPLRCDELRPKVARLLHEKGFPQAIVRLGHGPEVPPTPRRTVEEVMRVV